METTDGCGAARAWLNEASERELREGPRSPVLRAHLDECAECGDRLGGAWRLAEALRRWDTPAPRVNVQARVMASIARQERERARRGALGRLSGRAASMLRIRVQLPAYAAAALTVLLGISLYWNVAGERGGKSPVAAAPAPAMYVHMPPSAAASQASASVIKQTFNAPAGVATAGHAARYGAAPGVTLMPVAVLILGVPPSAGNTPAGPAVDAAVNVSNQL